MSYNGFAIRLLWISMTDVSVQDKLLFTHKT